MRRMTVKKTQRKPRGCEKQDSYAMQCERYDSFYRGEK